jgi:molybdopterin-containing oxidoreductase family iron-sulfur binding subunit
MNLMEQNLEKPARYGMVIDLDRCMGCGACMVACAVENNVPPAETAASGRTGITWLRVYAMRPAGSEQDEDIAYVPMSCQQCGHETPCIAVCPQNAVDIDPATGIVGQVPQRCLGCRYCMTACPYHARSFNWWDPKWPEGLDKQLNPDVSPRMRGVVEKCNFCHARLHRALAKAAMEGKREPDPAEYIPACVESCPVRAITFGNLADPSSDVARGAASSNAFRFLARLGTEPKVFYRSDREWVRRMADEGVRLEAKAEAEHRGQQMLTHAEEEQ